MSEPRTDGGSSWPGALARGLRAAVVPRYRSSTDPTIRTVSVAFVGNLVVAAAKWVGTVVSGSPAMLAESMHSTADTVNQALLLQGQLTSRRAETPEHPFGFGRARYFWAFVVAVAIFGIGAVLSVGYGVLALVDDRPGDSDVLVPYVTLAVGLVSDGWSFLVGTRQARKEKRRLSWWQYIHRSKNPEVPVVVLEDSVALVGVVLAFAGIGLSALTGNEVYDAVSSILIGLLLAVVSGILAREMQSLLIGESADPAERDRIRAALAGHPEVRGIVYFRSLYIGPQNLLVEAKVAFHPERTLPEVVAAIDGMEQEIRSRVPAVRVVSIEPGVDLGEDEFDLPDYLAPPRDDPPG